jgi:hypothetical protein
MAGKLKYPCRYSVNLQEWLALAYEDMAKQSGKDVSELIRDDMLNIAIARGYRAHSARAPAMNGHDEARA